MIVPDKKIAYVPLIADEGLENFDGNISTFLKPLNKNHKREWFAPNFYRCLPLSIGNMQGFAFSLPFTTKFIWNGGNLPNDIQIFSDNDFDFSPNMNHVHITSEFGHGIFTAHFPVSLKTPPGVNLMTIAPPNYPLPGISPMTGVIETDNLRFTFTLNFKIDIPNIPIIIEKNYPIMGIIPIPRYYCDSFELVNANDIFDKDIIDDEIDTINEHSKSRRESIKNNPNVADKLYYKGMDIRKNKFKDHQLPKGEK